MVSLAPRFDSDSFRAEMRLETPLIKEATLVEICSMTRGKAVPKDATSSTA